MMAGERTHTSSRDELQVLQELEARVFVIDEEVERQEADVFQESVHGCRWR